jgi:hypothetical protein
MLDVERIHPIRKQISMGQLKLIPSLLQSNIYAHDRPTKLPHNGLKPKKFPPKHIHRSAYNGNIPTIGHTVKKVRQAGDTIQEFKLSLGRDKIHKNATSQA